MLRFEERDHGAVGALARGRGFDLVDLDLAGDDVVARPGDDFREQLEPLSHLVGDQDAELER